MIKPADRLGNLTEYYFSQKLKEVAKLKADGADIINMGIGSPDLAPADNVISALIEGAISPTNHGYQPYQGIPDLRKEIVDFSRRKYGVSLKESMILPLLGSKEGITHISLAYLNPGDQVLVPSLGYPTYTSVSNMAQAERVLYPLLEAKNWEPDWDFLESLDYSRVKLLWLNYPHMPTGTKGSIEILRKFVGLALRKGILLCHDNPYSFIQNPEPFSIFQVEGSEEVALELNSLSKTFNMAGWRVGWLTGREDLLKPVVTVKSNMDSGMFKPLQLAAIEALKLGDEWYKKMDHIYNTRRILSNTFMEKLGCRLQSDQAGMFVWAKVAKGTGEELCDYLLYEKQIFVAPGHIFGEAGASYIRTSLCLEESLIQKAISRLS